MNAEYIETYLAYNKIDEARCKRVEEFGAVLASFTTKAYMFNATEDHEVWVYELDNRKFWIRKFEGKVVEFREI
jgi:hypothetical protein